MLHSSRADFPAGPAEQEAECAADLAGQRDASAEQQAESSYAADLDVAVVGGGIAGLATAVALHRLEPGWRVKVPAGCAAAALLPRAPAPRSQSAARRILPPPAAPC